VGRDRGWGALLTPPTPPLTLFATTLPTASRGEGKIRARKSSRFSRHEARPSSPGHCEPTGPARSGRPDDKLSDAIQRSARKQALRKLAEAPTGWLRFTRHDEKRRRNADKRIVHPPRHRARRALIADGARKSAHTIRFGARTPVGVPPRFSPKGLLIPKAQRWAMLPGTWPERSILDGRPNRGAETSRCSAALPAPCLSQSSGAPHAPVVVPAG
jgi:hypothetical protein